MAFLSMWKKARTNSCLCAVNAICFSVFLVSFIHFLCKWRCDPFTSVKMLHVQRNQQWYYEWIQLFLLCSTFFSLSQIINDSPFFFSPFSVNVFFSASGCLIAQNSHRNVYCAANMRTKRVSAAFMHVRLLVQLYIDSRIYRLGMSVSSSFEQSLENFSYY